jgi:hypothetical protein
MIRRHKAAFLLGSIGIAVVAVYAASWAATPNTTTVVAPHWGPWTIVMRDDAEGGYLVNTDTGDVWLLRGDVKIHVRDYTPEKQ